MTSRITTFIGVLGLTWGLLLGAPLTSLPASAVSEVTTSGKARAPQRKPAALTVRFVGLPPGARPAAVVTGPRKFKRLVRKTTTLRKLRPGRYTITPKTIAVTAQAYTAARTTVRVRPGKKIRATLTYRAPAAMGGTPLTPEVPTTTPTTTQPAPTPSPTDTPVTPDTPVPPVEPELVVSARQTLRAGEAAAVDTTRWLTSVESIRGATSQGVVSWSVTDGVLNVAVAATAKAGDTPVAIAVTGCVAGVCTKRVRIDLVVRIAALKAPADVPLTDMPAPSPDRIAQSEPASGQDVFLTDELLVTLGTPESPGGRGDADALARLVKATVTGGIEEAGIYQMRLTAGADVDQVIAALRADPRVYSVDRSRVMAEPIDAVTTGDFGELDKSVDWTWQLTQMRAPAAWKVDTGAGVKVGIVDGFVVDDHPDLAVVSRSGPYKDMRPNKRDKGWRKHATHVAGLACAIANGDGVVGSAKGCPIVSDSGLRTDGGFANSTLLAAVARVIKDGAQVVNLSMGNSGSKDPARNCVNAEENAAAATPPADAGAFRALVSGVVGRHVVFTVSAGNDCSGNSSSPFVAVSDLDNVISVAAANSDGQLAAFSSWDAEVAAGGGFHTRSGHGPYSTYPDETYERMEGTSMAAPLVAGVVAAVRAKHPKMSAPAVGRCIVNTGGALGRVHLRDDDWPAGYNPTVSFTGNIPVLDALAAIHCKPSVTPPYHPKTSDEWIARDPESGRSLLINKVGVYAITDGTVFDCLARSRVVWDLENLRALRNGTDGVQFGCSDSSQGKWDYRPDSEGGNTGSSVILRDKAGHSWFINGQAQRQAIETAGVYQCLTESFPVIFNVPNDKIEAWSPKNAKAADCNPAFAYAGSGGGDGWGIALSSSSVFNIFHHSSELTVACHRQVDASECWSPRTVQDGEGRSFATSGHPGMFLDQGTGYLFSYATRSDGTAGVVCFDTADTDAAGPCPDSDDGAIRGFTALTTVGQGGWPSQPAVVNDRFYAFNFVSGEDNSGSRNRLLCFDLTTFKACAGQPFTVEAAKGINNPSHWPEPQMTAIADRIIVRIAANDAEVLDCFDTISKARCKGSWPVNAASYSTWYGAPFPTVNSAGAATGFCLPTGEAACYTLAGESVSAPEGLVSAIGVTSGWNGSAVTLGDRVYVPNGNSNSVGCFDFGSGAACEGFPKYFDNAYLLYTVNADPFRPTCLWINSDSGSAQIQSFDAYTGKECTGSATA